MTRGIRLPLDACIKLAASQFGALSRDQALRAGLSLGALKGLVAEGIWLRIFPSTYALWTPPSPDESWHQRLVGAGLWLGEDSAVCRRSAAALWELDGIESPPVELITTRRRRSTTPGVFVHFTASLPPEDVKKRSGIRVTSAPRTLVDLAGTVKVVVLRLAVESALRRRLTTLDQIRGALERSPRTQPGRSALRRLLDQHPGAATESAAETLVWQILENSDLPPPVRQYVIREATGRFVARVDFAYPEARLAIEVDGFEFHSKRSDLRRDRAKRNRLAGLGWRAYFVTWEDVMQRPDAIIADIGILLAA